MYLATSDFNTAILTHHHYYLSRLKVGFVAAMVGNSHLRSGIGKSYTAMRTGELLDKDYKTGTGGMEKICFRPRDFTRAMDYVERSGKPAQVIILDEASLMVNSKKWHDYINRAIADSVVTFRTLRAMLICVAPHLGWLDKEVREYVSHRGECYKVLDPKGGLMVKCHYHRLFWDEYKGKYYKRRIKMYVRHDQNGEELNRLVEFRYWRVKHVENKELIEEYEKQAAKYKKEVRGGIRKLDEASLDLDELVKEILTDEVTRRNLVTPTTKGERVYEGDIKRHYSVSYGMARDISRKVNNALMKNEIKEIKKEAVV